MMKQNLDDLVIFGGLFILIAMAHFMGLQEETKALVNNMSGAMIMWLKGQIK